MTEKGLRAVLKRTWAAVSAAAVKDNFAAVRRVVGDDCRIMATVKADGYGHGAIPMAKAFAEAGAEWLSISNLNEAIELRDAGLDLPMLLLGYTPPEEVPVLCSREVTQTVFDLDYARRLSHVASAAGVTVKVHIKIDTGMSRLGFVYHDEATDIADLVEACRLPALDVEGVFTHFACADGEDEAPTRRQFALFSDVLARLEAEGITFRLRHCCNSAATLRFPEYHLDLVRPGLLLYGYAPFEGWELTPSMTLKSVVAQVKAVPAGVPVSYGGTAVTERDCVLATVPIGYADGLPRAASDKAVMLVGGGEARIVGRVCMDQCILDVTGLDVKTGDEVIVFGRRLSAERLADSAGTIVYEILCRVGQRVPRTYSEKGG